MAKKKNLPKRVYIKHGAYYYVTLERKWIRLGKTESEMYRALSDLNAIGGNTMLAYFDRYTKEDTPKKAVSTQKMEAYSMANLQRVFGEMKPENIKPSHVYKYHTLRSKTAKASADREKALLSSVMNKVMMEGIINTNPCTGVKKNPSKPRDRYVTDQEFQAVRKHASPILRATMDIAILTGLRMGDILKLTTDDLKEKGIYCKTSKTTRALIFLWSEALHDAIEHARASSNGEHYIISNKHGQRYTASGFKSLWQRTIKRACQAENIERFQFRDLRTKAGCDLVGDATRLLGHSSDKITKRHYEILPWEVKPTK